MLESRVARADVSNPDYYYIDITDTGFYYRPNSTSAITDTGTLEGDIASDSSFAYNASSFGSTGATAIGTLNAQYIIGASGTSGVVDPDTGEVTLTLNMRIKFTGQAAGLSVGTSCQTSFFSVTLSTTKSSNVYTPQSFNVSDGSFSVVAEDFVVPAVTSTNCGGSSQAAAINGQLGLGNSSGDMAVFFAGSITNPAVPHGT